MGKRKHEEHESPFTRTKSCCKSEQTIINDYNNSEGTEVGIKAPSGPISVSVPPKSPNQETGNSNYHHHRAYLSRTAGLLNALNDLLDAPEATELGKSTVADCTALRERLTQSSPSQPPGPTTSSFSSKITTPSDVTPWSSSSIPATIPPLPCISSAPLELACFTHSGYLPRGSNSSNSNGGGDLTYERLEWVGDAYLYLLSTLLISKTFPTHPPGRCAQLREMLVKNETLAGYARRYGFEGRARLPADFAENHRHQVMSSSNNYGYGGMGADGGSGRRQHQHDYGQHQHPRQGHGPSQAERTKVMGDIFEAYVAGVVLSDPRGGVDTAAAWLKALWSTTLAREIRGEEERARREAHSRDDPDRDVPPKELLAKRIMSKGIRLSYRDDAPPRTDKSAPGLQVFSVGLYLDGWGESGFRLGAGVGKSKKEAGAKAAEAALSNKQVMSRFEAMKREHDQKVAEERAATSTLESRVEDNVAD